jgi:hypothetical protein
MATLSVVPFDSGGTVKQLIEDYLLAARARGCRPRTVEGSYGYPLRSIFLPWCEKQGFRSIAELDGRTVD